MSSAPLTALVLWRREIGNGLAGQSARRPDSWHRDALWRAACLEASALELEYAGLLAAAERLRDAAAETILAEDTPPEAA